MINGYTTSNGAIKRTNIENFFIFGTFTVAPYNQDSVFKSMSHTNRLNRFDVNSNGVVSSLDALDIINALNRNVVNLTPKTQTTAEHLDVNGDNKVTAQDALMIINELSRLQRQGL